MNTDEIIKQVTKNLNKPPNISDYSLAESVLALGVYYTYSLFFMGKISEKEGAEIKTTLKRKCELLDFHEGLYLDTVKSLKNARYKAVEFQKGINTRSDTENLLQAINLLDLCNINGGIPFELKKKGEKQG